MNKIVLIVAGGSGARMKADIPKQFLLLNNRPVLMHTISIFYKYDKDIRIILVLPGEQIGYWKNLCNKDQFIISHEVRSGGETRFHSVKKNLDIIPDTSLVAIHDGVRPLVSLETIDRCFASALKFGNAIPCIGIPESLREIGVNNTRQVDRTKYRLIQTPQVFKGSILKEAYLQNYDEKFTDDAGVLEHAGYTIHLVEGNAENIKITVASDMIIAASLLR